MQAMLNKLLYPNNKTCMRPIHSLIIVCCLALLAASGAQAAVVYKFRDGKGIVTFTDQPTRGAQVLVYGDRFVEKLDTRVRIETQKHPSGDVLTLVNELYAPVEIELTIKNARNVSPLATSKIHRVLPERSKTPILQLKPLHAGKMDYRHSLRFALSDPKMEPLNFAYPVPWTSGQYKVTQGPGGKHSHQDEKGRYAIDFAMPVGTRIAAARGGKVVSTDQSQREGNGSKAGNYVRILHDDGTMSVYLHLKQNGVLVKEGQRVKAGDVIAYSGNTGSSTGAHLHFVVQQNVGMKVISVPFKFADPNGGVAFVPKPGEWLGTTEVAKN